MAMETCGEKVMALCYWNGVVKYGPDGIYYEGSSTTLKMISVKRKTKLSRFLDALYPIIGLDKEKSKLEIFGRYPVAVSPHRFTYSHLPVVDDSSLETMHEVPSNHPSIKAVELYLEVRSTSDDVVDLSAHSSPLGSEGSSLKIQSTEHEKTDTNPRTDVSVEVVNPGVSKPCLVSSLWLDGGHEWRVGLCFKDKDELKKAVNWFSIRGRRKCVVRETEKDVYTFECVRCNWLLCAARKEEHGLVEITKYSGLHTCNSEDSDSEVVAHEIERVVTLHPTVSISELNKWWKEKFGYELETSKMQEAKLKVITRVFGDDDESFSVIPKLMSALHSSNGLLVDWLYDLFPNPEFASFRSVFWAFPQSVEGFQHCRPVITVDSRNLYGLYPLTLMIASGVDAANKDFPLAFAVTKEESVDSWRWFLNRIREKVTQRKGLCLISRYHQDIVDVINEPESQWKEPWAYHRYCLNHFCSLLFEKIRYDHSLKCLVEKAGSTDKKEEFDSYMKDIEKKNQEARKWLDQFPPHMWALSHDSGLRYGIIKIDREAAVCQSFPFHTLTMSGGVMLLFDELRDAFEASFSFSRDSLNHGDVYTKPVMDKLEEFMTSYATYDITPLDKDSFQVTRTFYNKEWIVRLNDSTCTCGGFQIYKFPCLHALTVCEKLKINPLQYVDECYTFERLYKTYSAKFNPVQEVSSWPEVSGVPTLFPPFPPSLLDEIDETETDDEDYDDEEEEEEEDEEEV